MGTDRGGGPRARTHLMNIVDTEFLPFFPLLSDWEATPLPHVILDAGDRQL